MTDDGNVCGRLNFSYLAELKEQMFTECLSCFFFPGGVIFTEYLTFSYLADIKEWIPGATATAKSLILVISPDGERDT